MKYFIVLIMCMNVSTAFCKGGEKEQITYLVSQAS